MPFLYGLSAAVAFACMNFVLKHFCQDASAAAQAFIRGGIGVVYLFPTFWETRRVFVSKEGLKFWGRSICGSASVMCLFLNLKQATVGDATMLSNLSPVFVIILQYVFLSESIRRNEFLGTLIVVGGVVALSSPRVQALDVTVIGTGLLGALFAAAAYLTLKRASQHFSSRQIVWAFCLMMMVAATFFGGVDDVVEIIQHVQQGLLPVLAMVWLLVAGILGLLAQLLMTRAFTGLPAIVAASLTLSMVLWGIVFESLYLQTLPKPAAIVSYFVVLSGLVVVQVRKRVGIPGRLGSFADDFLR